MLLFPRADKLMKQGCRNVWPSVWECVAYYVGVCACVRVCVCVFVSMGSCRARHKGTHGVRKIRRITLLQLISLLGVCMNVRECACVSVCVCLNGRVRFPMSWLDKVSGKPPLVSGSFAVVTLLLHKPANKHHMVCIFCSKCTVCVCVCACVCQCQDL